MPLSVPDDVRRFPRMLPGSNVRVEAVQAGKPPDAEGVAQKLWEQETPRKGSPEERFLRARFQVGQMRNAFMLRGMTLLKTRREQTPQVTQGKDERLILVAQSDATVEEMRVALQTYVTDYLRQLMSERHPRAQEMWDLDTAHLDNAYAVSQNREQYDRMAEIAEAEEGRETR